MLCTYTYTLFWRVQSTMGLSKWYSCTTVDYTAVSRLGRGCVDHHSRRTPVDTSDPVSLSHVSISCSGLTSARLAQAKFGRHLLVGEGEDEPDGEAREF